MPRLVAGRPTQQFRALFDPQGVLVAGACTHPGKFGFVSLHNILASGYAGQVFGTNLEGEEVLGIQTVADIADLPDGAIDLVFVCTPAAANVALLRGCAAKGVKAAFLTSAGYGEAGDAGRVAEAELVALADELGILLAGPNGQGVVSTPANLCAQIVAPYPPARPHRRRQPERQLRQQLPELRPPDRRRHQPRGVGRQRRRGDASRLPRLVRRRSRDGGVARLRRGDRRRSRVCSTRSPRSPGASRSWSSRAARPRAAPRRRPATPARSPPTTRSSTARAARRASPGPPRSRRRSRRPPPSPPSRCREGPNVVVLTTAGGWGVVTSDAIARAEGST